MLRHTKPLYGVVYTSSATTGIGTEANDGDLPSLRLRWAVELAFPFFCPQSHFMASYVFLIGFPGLSLASHVN